jgi:hypothetical protein
MLWPGCFLSTDIAAAAPGAVCHALYAELDVTAQHPDKLLLNFLRAGEQAGLCDSDTARLGSTLCKQTGMAQGSDHTSKQDSALFAEPQDASTLPCFCMRLAWTQGTRADAWA